MLHSPPMWVATFWAVLLLMLQHDHGVVHAWPGQGVVSLYYYAPEWQPPIFANFTSYFPQQPDGVPTPPPEKTSTAMSEWPGLIGMYRGRGWHYVEIGANNITVCFSNAAGDLACDPSGGNETVPYAIDTPGTFVINGSSLEVLQMFTSGCPGSPAAFPRTPCNDEGNCDATRGVCDCYPGFTGNSCGGATSCQFEEGAALLMNSSTMFIELSTETMQECCAECTQNSECLGANFDANAFSCALASQLIVDPISNKTYKPTKAFQYAITPVVATPVPSTPPPSGGGGLSPGERTTIGIGIGVGVAIVAISVVVAYRWRKALEDGDEGAAGEGSPLLQNNGPHSAVSGRYEPLRVLGRGATCTVYLARKHGEGSGAKLFALKVIVCTTEEEMLQGWREFQLVRQLQGHRGIAGVVDMFMHWEAEGRQETSHSESDLLARREAQASATGSRASSTSSTPAGGMSPAGPGSADAIAHRISVLNAAADAAPMSIAPSRFLNIVMEYYAGGTLEEVIVRNPTALTLPCVLDYAVQILEALEFSHSKRVIHGDIKPANILVAEGGAQIVLTDFGHAKEATESRGSMSAQGGTFQFLSPEQLTQHKCSNKSDVWSAGCVLYAMALRVAGKHMSAMFSTRQKPNFERDTRERIAVHVPVEPFADLVLCMLREDPAERPTATEALAALHCFHVSDNAAQVVLGNGQHADQSRGHLQ